MDERFQVQDSTLLLKKNHYGKAGRTWHYRREFTDLGQYFALKSFTMERQVGHCIKDKRL